MHYQMQLEEQIRQHADKAFLDHEITLRSKNGLYRSWRCCRPGSWTYGFDITTIPGSLFITGDIGDLIVSRTDDMVQWCRGSTGSTSYFAEKVPHGFVTREFKWEVFREWCEEWKKDNAEDDNFAEKCEVLEEVLGREGSIGEEGLYQELWNEFAFDEPPSWRCWTPRFLWCREAIRWFCLNVKEE